MNARQAWSGSESDQLCDDKVSEIMRLHKCYWEVLLSC